MKKVLVIVAHPDDEVLGVGGTILKCVQAGDKVAVLILGDGETSRGEKAKVERRQTQAQAAAVDLGVKLYAEKIVDQKFDTIPLLDIIKLVEKVIGDFEPDTVYTHHANDLNIDHQLTFKAVLTACRPQPGFCVKKILAFETLSSTEWQAKTAENIFCPTVYEDVSNFLEKKILVLNHYQDELRPWPYPRSSEGVRILAKYRGLEVGLAAAEAFELIRSIN